MDGPRFVCSLPDAPRAHARARIDAAGVTCVVTRPRQGSCICGRPVPPRLLLDAYPRPRPATQIHTGAAGAVSIDGAWKGLAFACHTDLRWTAGQTIWMVARLRATGLAPPRVADLIFAVTVVVAMTNLASGPLRCIRAVTSLNWFPGTIAHVSGAGHGHGVRGYAGVAARRRFRARSAEQPSSKHEWHHDLCKWESHRVPIIPLTSRMNTRRSSRPHLASGTTNNCSSQPLATDALPPSSLRKRAHPVKEQRIEC